MCGTSLVSPKQSELRIPDCIHIRGCDHMYMHIYMEDAPVIHACHERVVCYPRLEGWV